MQNDAVGSWENMVTWSLQLAGACWNTAFQHALVVLFGHGSVTCIKTILPYNPQWFKWRIFGVCGIDTSVNRKMLWWKSMTCIVLNYRFVKFLNCPVTHTVNEEHVVIKHSWKQTRQSCTHATCASFQFLPILHVEANLIGFVISYYSILYNII